MLTDLYNAIMQLIFIITGLVSVKTMVGLITELVGQGDALKDGEETSKEVKKRTAQTAGLAMMGAGASLKIAKAGAKATGSVAKKGLGYIEDKTHIGSKTKALAGRAATYVGNTGVGQKVKSGVATVKGASQAVHNARGLEKMRKEDPDAYANFVALANSGDAMAQAMLTDHQRVTTSYAGIGVLSAFQAGGYAKKAGKGAIKAGKGAAGTFWDATKDVRKQVASMSGISDAYKDAAKESGFDDNKIVEGIGNKLFGYKSDTTKRIQGHVEQADVFIARSHGYAVNNENVRSTPAYNRPVKTEMDANAVLNTKDVNINGATTNVTSGSASTTAGTSSVTAPSASATGMAINTKVTDPIEVRGGELGLDSATIGAIKESGNHTADSINQRLLMVTAGLGKVAEKINNLDSSTRRSNELLKDIAANTKKDDTGR